MGTSVLSPRYVTGFVEGAGSFTFNRGRGQLTLVFAVRVGATNRRLVEALRGFFGGIGRIYDTSSTKNPMRPATKAACFFRVNRPRELMRIVEHFDAHPLIGDKLDSYRIWREMVLLRAAHSGVRMPARLEALAEQLSQSRRPPAASGRS